MILFDIISELSVADRRNKKEIRHLEQELPKWQVLVDSVTGKQFCKLHLLNTFTAKYLHKGSPMSDE